MARPVTGEAATDAPARALRRADAALLAAPVLEAVIARREAGRERPADAGHARALASTLCSFQGEDGSWSGDLLRTAEALLLLRALQPAPDGGATFAAAAGIAWIQSRRGLPGAVGTGCAPERHALRFCEHFLKGFFSPAPPTVDLGSLTLSSGVRFGGDAAARLGASCIALRAVLAWGGGADDIAAHVAPHLDGLRVVVTGVALNAPSLISVPAYVSAVGALVEAPRSPGLDAAVATGIERLAALQRADGSWRGVDAFHVLDLLLRALAAGHRVGAGEAALRRAAVMLALLQREDGSWGRETGPDRTLIGWRTLRHVVAAGDGRADGG